MLFGAVVSVFFKEVFDKHAQTFEDLGISSNNGLGELYSKIENLDAAKKAEIIQDIETVYVNRPALAMVNSD